MHFSRFVPLFQLKNLPKTDVTTLEKCRKVAQAQGMRHVYIANLSPHEGNNTYCYRCGKAIIKRLGFQVIDYGIVNGRCKHCKTTIAGVWN